MPRLNLVALSTLLPLAACGPSEDNGIDPPVVVIDPTTYVSITDGASTETSDIISISVSEQTAALIQSGTLDRTSGLVTVGSASGPFNASTLVVDLDDGTRFTIENLSTEFVERVTIQPSLGATSVGLVGVPTAPEGLPTTGSMTYTGSDLARVQLLTGTASYDLTGDVSMTADFGRGEIDITLSALDGNRLNSSGSVAVTDVATIEILDGSLANGQFSGGNFGITSSEIPTNLSPSATFEMEGTIFGPGADEAGGVLRINDTDFVMLGTFVGD